MLNAAFYKTGANYLTKIIRYFKLSLIAAIFIFYDKIEAAPVNYETATLTSPAQINGDQWNSVTFTRSFAAAPVVIMSPTTQSNGDPCVVRVRNVTATGFQYQLDEWDHLDGVHPAETLQYLAISEGTHVFGAQRWQVGRQSGVNRNETTVSLSDFSTPPVVLTQIYSTANQAGTTGTKGVKAIKARVSDVTSTSYKVRLQTQESDTATLSNESVGYVAVAIGRTFLDGRVVSAIRVTNGVNSNFATITYGVTRNSPTLFAQSQTFKESDPGELKYQNLTSTSVQLRYQEETSRDAETTHASEDLGYLIMGTMGGESQSKLEIGDVIVTQSNATTWTTVNLSRTYNTPVVVMGPLSHTRGAPLTVRVRNVKAGVSGTSNASFEFQIDRWSHNTVQTHEFKESLSYMVMEAGTHAIGGNLWQAGVSTGVTQSASSQTLSTMFNRTVPVVLPQVVTTNDTQTVQARVSSVTDTNFNLELDESEIDRTEHAGETVHWFAFMPGVSNLFSTRMRFEVGTFTDVSSSFSFKTFRRLHADPFFFAATQTQNDTDPNTLRWRYLFADKVELLTQEDGHPAQFGETTVSNSHDAENVGYVIVQGAEDTDEDGAPNQWEIDNGLNPNSASDGSTDSDNDLLNNQQEYHNRIDFETSSNPRTFTGGTITVSAPDHNAYEVNDRSASTQSVIPGRFRISRAGGLAPLTINYTASGSPITDSNRAPASSSDYGLWTSPDGRIAANTSIGMAANSQGADVFVRPVVDTINEYREGVRLQLSSNGSSYDLGSLSTATVNILDAQDITANEQLFVGTFLPQGSAVTSGSGYATVILNGSKTSAKISTFFNGLTTPQTDVDGSHVHFANTGTDSSVSNGTIIYGNPNGLPRGPLYEYGWTITDAAGLKGQKIIDALFRKNTGEGLYVNVHTTRYADGELRADLKLQTGSATFIRPAEAPSLENLANEEQVRRECARFLTQATFGASEADISALYNSIESPRTSASNRIAAFKSWLNTQWGRDQTRLYDYTYAADQQEWALLGQTEKLSDGLPPPNNATDWTRWGNSNYRALPNGLNKRDYSPKFLNRRHAAWTIMRYAHDQLRQRVGSALEQIFVVSDRESTIKDSHYGHARYLDMLTDAADGVRSIQPPNGAYTTANNSAFTVRHLLEDISKHPIMGQYLSSLQNQKAVFGNDGNAILSPDENYAREIMQLFTIGLFELHPDGSLKLASNGQPIATYDNEDIKQLSRVFTGWSFAWSVNTAANGFVPTLAQNNFFGHDGFDFFHPGFESPMKVFRVFHEEGAKRFLTASIPAYLGSSTDSSARDAYAESDMDTTMDTLFDHPNIAPFLSRLLIQRLVTSNPSRGYIYRVAQVFADDNGSAPGGVRGNLRAVVNAILLDYEARTLRNVDPQTENNNTSVNVSFGKVKEPIIRYMQLLRALGAKSQIDLDETSPSTNDLAGYGLASSQLDNYIGGGTQMRYSNTINDLAQQPHSIPSVFNWYLPDYSPGGRISLAGLYAPELQIITENIAVRSVNFHRIIISSNIFDPTSTTLPVGEQVRELLGDSTGSQDNIYADISDLVADYKANRDANGATNLSATIYLVNRLDRLLCSGALQAKYPYVEGGKDPRSIMIDKLVLISNGNTPLTLTLAANRVRAAIYLITSSPEYIVQK
jgi:uncharacterized protein (DUF1800 family)